MGGGAGATTCCGAGVGPKAYPCDTVCVALPLGMTTIVGFHLAGRQQVVEDDRGAAHRRPGIFIAAAAVQQVEHRVFRRRRLVVGRQPDIHAPASLLERGRGKPDLLDRAVRHVLEVPQLRFLANHQQVVVAVAVALRLAVARIERLHAIGEEPVAPQLRRHRTDRHRPDAGSSFVILMSVPPSQLPLSVTSWDFGAKKRNVTVLSG